MLRDVALLHLCFRHLLTLTVSAPSHEGDNIERTILLSYEYRIVVVASSVYSTVALRTWLPGCLVCLTCLEAWWAGVPGVVDVHGVPGVPGVHGAADAPGVHGELGGIGVPGVLGVQYMLWRMCRDAWLCGAPGVLGVGRLKWQLEMCMVCLVCLVCLELARPRWGIRNDSSSRPIAKPRKARYSLQK